MVIYVKCGPQPSIVLWIRAISKMDTDHGTSHEDPSRGLILISGAGMLQNTAEGEETSQKVFRGSHPESEDRQ